MISRIRQDLLSIFEACLEAIAPDRAVKESIRKEGNYLFIKEKRVPLADKRLHLIAVGKAARKMAGAAREVLGEVEGGIVVSNEEGEPIPPFTFIRASHPYPDSRSLQAGKAILDYVSSLDEDDLLLFLISGGASALMVYPREGISLEDKVSTMKLLLKTPATIREINTVRKHLSAVKGGFLARAAHPALVITLAISDIVYDPLPDIGSGPTVPDPSTFSQAMEVLEKYNLLSKVPETVVELFKRGAEGKAEETPKPGPEFEADLAFVILNNRTALEAARRKAVQLGFDTFVLTSFEEGRVEKWVDVYSRILEERLNDGRLKKPLLFLSGGEITVEVLGKGKGGRNQEFVLRMMHRLSKYSRGWAVASFGSDGLDGPTDAAGAIADPYTLEKARQLGLDAEKFIADNDSYSFFEATGDLIKTGPTGTNVMDIRMMVIF